MSQLLSLTATLLVCILHVATAIKCYQCTPDPLSGEMCTNPTNSTTCEAFYDSCMSLSITMKTPMGELSSGGMMCGVKAQCGDQAQQAACDAANSTGMVTKCSVNCCQKDLCNGGGTSTTAAPTTLGGTSTTAAPTTLGGTQSPTSAGQRAVVNLGAIFTAALLSLPLMQAKV